MNLIDHQAKIEVNFAALPTQQFIDIQHAIKH